MKRRGPVSRQHKTRLTIVSVTLTLYFALSLTRDLAAGSSTWAIYIPGLFTSLAMTILVQRISTDDGDNSSDRPN